MFNYRHKVNTIVALFLFNGIYAQYHSIISGYVYDDQSGIPLANVNIIIVSTDLGAASDETGYFDIHQVSPGQYQVKASRIDYGIVVKDSIQVQPNSKVEINFYLKSAVLQMPSIGIEADKFSLKYESEVARI